MSAVRHVNAMITRASARYNRVSSTIARWIATMRGTVGGLEADATWGRPAKAELSRITRPLPDAQGLVTYGVLACPSWAGTWLAYADVAVSATHEAASTAAAITQMGNC